MPQFLPHPGKIKVVEFFSKTTEMKSPDEFPESGQFVYLKNGVETYDPNEATERIPIVEVHVLPLNDQGNLVDPKDATSMIIKQFGPEQRPLRSTTMQSEQK